MKYVLSILIGLVTSAAVGVNVWIASNIDFGCAAAAITFNLVAPLYFIAFSSDGKQ